MVKTHLYERSTPPPVIKFDCIHYRRSPPRLHLNQAMTEGELATVTQPVPLQLPRVLTTFDAVKIGLLTATPAKHTSEISV